MSGYSQLQPNLIILTDAATGQARQIRLINDNINFEQIDNTLLQSIPGYAQGLAAAIPAAGHKGRVYYATDTGVYYIDDGTNWHPVGVSATATHVELQMSADQTIASGATDKILFDTSIYDEKGDGDTTNHKITIPEGGYYLFNLSLGIDPYADNDLWHIEPYLNGSLFGDESLYANTSGLQNFNFSGVFKFSTTDYIEIYVNNSGGGNGTIYHTSNRSFFEINRITT